MNELDRARSTLYRLFSVGFYLPEKELEEILINLRDWLELYNKKLKREADKLLNIFKKTSLEDLQVEYTKLFLGPMNIKALPYASCYLQDDPYLMGNISQYVESIYREKKVYVDIPEAPDHIAIELEFLYFLTSKNLLNEEKLFKKHLTSWFPQFKQKIEGTEIGEFYPKFANLLSRFLEPILPNKD